MKVATVSLSNVPLKGRPPTKRDIRDPWTTTLSGWTWWGDGYMAVRGEPFWPDLDVQDLDERFDGVPVYKGFGPRAFRSTLSQVIRAHNAGDTLPIRLDEDAIYHAPGCVYPVFVARSARNGQRMRGYPSGPCIANAGLVRLIERRVGGGRWFVSECRSRFIYDVDGRMRALVMGIRANGGRLSSSSHDDAQGSGT